MTHMVSQLFPHTSRQVSKEDDSDPPDDIEIRQSLNGHGFGGALGFIVALTQFSIDGVLAPTNTGVSIPVYRDESPTTHHPTFKILSLSFATAQRVTPPRDAVRHLMPL